MIDFHIKMMKRAISLARRGIGKTAPNPSVGCVIVNNGEIVGEGWHKKAGTPHAEIHALCQAGERARGAEVYVTLEPCSHFGKTPPCAEALINAGVAKVFIGMTDPNPLVNGKGVEELRKAGIVVECGVMEQDCIRLNEPFIKHVTTGLPFVIHKAAMTLDGCIATSKGESKWITNEKSRKYVHRLRAMVDAVMVGVGTVIADDPQLTCRMGVRGGDPWRIIVDSRLRTPLSAAVLTTGSVEKTIIATIEHDSSRRFAFESLGARVMVCREADGRVDLRDLLRRLGEHEIQSVLLEGGSELAGTALRQGLIDKYLLFYAPKILGGADGTGLYAGKGPVKMADAIRLKDLKMIRFDEDILIQGYPEKSCSQDL